MARTPAEDLEPVPPPSHDDRPNSGLREGEISHAEVNEAIRMAPKTVIFGQQSRLRLGLLTEDEQLPRYHAGHDLVKFFYGAIRQVPEYLLDAILAAGISVTLVRANDLLVFHDVRTHQSFLVGRTRKTIHAPLVHPLAVALRLRTVEQVGYRHTAPCAAAGRLVEARQARRPRVAGGDSLPALRRDLRAAHSLAGETSRRRYG